MKNFFRAFLICFVLCAAANAYALPTLRFGGSLKYESGDRLLHVDAGLTGYQDLTGVSDPLEGEVEFSALFVSMATDGFFPVGIFGEIPDTPDLVIKDGEIILLEGDFLSLTMKGVGNFGTLEGGLRPSGGGLLWEFCAGSDVIALVLNLTTDFNPDMFEGDFSGLVSGKVEANAAPVPEPATGILGALGVVLFSAFRKFNFFRRESGT